jgi:hypothetical protein
MSITLPALVAAFAAFCVWLTVRIVNRSERWAKWTAAGIVAFFIIYPVSYPWAQAIYINAYLKAESRGEQLPIWIDAVATKFQAPMGWAMSVMPEFVLVPLQSYNEWSLKKSGIDLGALRRIGD